MLTGQYVRTHGVVANGIPLPADAPSVAAYLHDKAGYRTALLGKAHFEPGFDPTSQWRGERPRRRRGDTGPWRGFERSDPGHARRRLRATIPIAPLRPLAQGEPPRAPAQLRRPARAPSPAATPAAPETKNNPIPREWYHTDWVADLTVDWLARSLGDDDRGSAGCRFPDPHHPWDPPASELDRVPWQDLDLPPGHPGSRRRRSARCWRSKPAHWLAYWEGRFVQHGGRPGLVRPPAAHPRPDPRDQRQGARDERAHRRGVRPGAADRSRPRGWLDDTDVIFTTDHGELQGDFGLLYKGPYHTDALMRLPFVWRPAPSAGVAPGGGDRPGRARSTWRPRSAPSPASSRRDWMQGRALPAADGEPGASARCASGTASSPATACTCARSTATAGCARSTSRPRPASPTASRRSGATAS